MWLKKLNKIGQYITILSTAFICVSSCQANDFVSAPNYDAFKQNAMQKYGLTSGQIDQAMASAKSKPNILNIMQRPGESKPWYQYQSMFLTPYTIQKGIQFKNQYSAVLQQAEQQFGVTQAVILGILGVETGYGSNKGSISTRDALATLAFGYPRRAEYFSDELAALIAWTYKDGDPIESITGSYAGAVGYPQFMPSNIAKYGIDYDGNGHVDLRNSAPDAIASIANYLAKQGWQKDRPIGFAARYTGTTPETVISQDLNKPVPFGLLKEQGVTPLDPLIKIDDFELVNLIQLQGENGPIYYITYPNFQVITTYNRSRMYATAVWQLGEEVQN